MIDDDFRPVARDVEIDQEPETESQEDEAEPDGLEEAASDADVDACEGGGEGHCGGEGEEPDAGEEGRGAENALEVEGEVECTHDKNGAVDETRDEICSVRGGGEETEGHEGVASYSPFNEDKEDCCYQPENDKTDDDGRGPGVGDAAEFEAEEEHDC